MPQVKVTGFEVFYFLELFPVTPPPLFHQQTKKERNKQKTNNTKATSQPTNQPTNHPTQQTNTKTQTNKETNKQTNKQRNNITMLYFPCLTCKALHHQLPLLVVVDHDHNPSSARLDIAWRHHKQTLQEIQNAYSTQFTKLYRFESQCTKTCVVHCPSEIRPI